MSNGSDSRILIIGGSFAGLAAAIALRRVGFEVAVFERTAELRGLQAGVVLQITAMKALKKIGMLPQVQQVAGPPIREIQLQTPEGQVLAVIPQSRQGRELGVPAAVVNRAAFLQVLAQALEDSDAIHLGAECAGLEADEQGVTARFAGGWEVRGALLLGADGIHSAIRRQLRGDEPLRYSGYTAWRAMPAFRHQRIVPGILQQPSERGQIFGIYPGKDAVYWFAGQKTPAGGVDAPAGRKEELLHLFQGWHEPIEALIAATDEATILRNDVYDRVPVDHWGAGRVTLLGDAAHPATPTLGQGAGMSIEDGVVLAKELALAHDLTDYEAVDNALRAYERSRMPRTAAINRESWQIGQMILRENPVALRVQRTFLRLTPKRVWRQRGEADAAYEA
jgi:2-polyprenyl-6-methoxyphenol hydroxylase-like FAD-dependent oxidoreductase